MSEWMSWTLAPTPRREQQNGKVANHNLAADEENENGKIQERHRYRIQNAMRKHLEGNSDVRPAAGKWANAHLPFPCRQC